MIWVASVLTALWIGTLSYFALWGWPNWLPGGALQPNTLGDTLSGVFAPLAFLWLFAATWLQRAELKLQRRELADTRVEFKAQREELAATARENVSQTRIMNETLAATKSRAVYDEHALRLYYLSRYFTLRNNQTLIYGKDSSENPIFYRPYEIPTKFVGGPNEPLAVDRVFEKVRTLAHDFMSQTKYFVFLNPISNSDLSKFAAAVDELHLLISEEPFISNGMVIARVNGCELGAVHRSLSAVLEWAGAQKVL